MNTNTFACGLDRFITMAEILLDFALFLVSVTTEGMGGRTSGQLNLFQNLRHKAAYRQVANYSLFLTEKVSPPYAVHSSCQQMGILQVTVHSLCLLQL